MEKLCVPLFLLRNALHVVFLDTRQATVQARFVAKQSARCVIAMNTNSPKKQVVDGKLSEPKEQQ